MFPSLKAGWRFPRPRGALLAGILLVLGAWLAGCNQAQPDFGLSGNSSQFSRDSVPTVQPLAVLPGAGKLAYIGADGNVYLATPRGVAQPVTDDASVPFEGQDGRSYHRLAWSPRGQLAFAAVERTGELARSQLYVLAAPGDQPRLVSRSAESFVIYIAWPPAEACQPEASCRRLAFLRREGAQIGLYLADLDGGPGDERLVAAGRPVYFSWSPQGEHLLVHAGGPRSADSRNELDSFALEVGAYQRLLTTPGFFQSPAWLPGGDSWLAVLARDGQAGLHRLAFPGRQGAPAMALLPEVEAGREMVFSLSPDGRRLAYAYRSSRSALYYAPVRVYDLESGHDRAVTGQSFQILGFFWSPDGTRLAYLTRQQVENETWMQWRVVDELGAEDRGYTVFRPAPAWTFMLQSFSQYAGSHRFWSPEGRYLVYAARGDDRIDRIWLVDTGPEGDRRPMLLADGSWAVWSWE